MRIIITVGAGFIGINLVKYWLSATNHKLLIIDKFGYASNHSVVEQLSK